MKCQPPFPDFVREKSFAELEDSPPKKCFLHILWFPSFALTCIIHALVLKYSYAHIGKKYDLMFSAWPVHGEGESKKVDVTVAHRKVLLADAEYATNLQKTFRRV